MARRAGATAAAPILSPHFLALEDHIADDEQHDRARDHADHLRPGDQHALDSGSGAPSTAPWSWLR